MSKSNPQPGDVFINTRGNPVPYPILVVRGESYKLSTHIIEGTSSGVFNFGIGTHTVEEIKVAPYIKFVFAFPAKELEEIIMQKYNNGDFDNVPQD